MPDVAIGEVDVKSYNSKATLTELNAARTQLKIITTSRNNYREKYEAMSKKYKTVLAESKAQAKKLRYLASHKHDCQVVKTFLERAQMSECQVHRIMHPKRQTQRGYTTQDISFALVLKSLSTEAYEFLRKESILALPSLELLNQWLRKTKANGVKISRKMDATITETIAIAEEVTKNVNTNARVDDMDMTDAILNADTVIADGQDDIGCDNDINATPDNSVLRMDEDKEAGDEQEEEDPASLAESHQQSTNHPADQPPQPPPKFFVSQLNDMFVSNEVQSHIVVGNTVVPGDTHTNSANPQPVLCPKGGARGGNLNQRQETAVVVTVKRQSKVDLSESRLLNDHDYEKK